MASTLKFNALPHMSDARAKHFMSRMGEFVEDGVFVVMKSTNYSAVIYAFNHEFDETARPLEPLFIFWLSVEEARVRAFKSGRGPSITNALNALEKTGYGVTVINTEEPYKLRLNVPQFAGREYSLVSDSEGNPMIMGKMAGVDVRLQYAYIQLADCEVGVTQLIPRVACAYLVGTTLNEPEPRIIKEEIMIDREAYDELLERAEMEARGEMPRTVDPECGAM